MKLSQIICAGIIVTLASVACGLAVVYAVSTIDAKDLSPAQLTVLRFCTLTGAALIALLLHYFWIKCDRAGGRR